MKFKFRPKTAGQLVAAIFAILAIIAGVLGLQTLVIMWAWNTVIAGAFGGVTLTFWQSFGVFVALCLVASAFKRHSVEK